MLQCYFWVVATIDFRIFSFLCFMVDFCDVAVLLFEMLQYIIFDVAVHIFQCCSTCFFHVALHIFAMAQYMILDVAAHNF